MGGLACAGGRLVVGCLVVVVVPVISGVGVVPCRILGSAVVGVAPVVVEGVGALWAVAVAGPVCYDRQGAP